MDGGAMKTVTASGSIERIARAPLSSISTITDCPAARCASTSRPQRAVAIAGVLDVLQELPGPHGLRRTRRRHEVVVVSVRPRRGRIDPGRR